MDKLYYRPIVQTDALRPKDARVLAGGWGWFASVEVLSRAGSRGEMAAHDLPAPIAARLTAPRAPLAGLVFDRPRIMGILNVTPDSFSDGGRFNTPQRALAQAMAMAAAGADVLDIGGESTRPGAAFVADADEIARTAPVISALRAGGFTGAISVDTRKAAVARAALAAGADLVNDVSALGHDARMATLIAQSGAPVCLMHAQGTPQTMQLAPRYDNVLLDVYDYLEARLTLAETAGIVRNRILVDPGIGFGKTEAHNLTLLRGLSLFHGLGCAVLLGVSRKRFIGSIGGAEVAEDRAPGTLALTLAGLSQGVQMHRVHDVAEVAQGVRLWQAVTIGDRV
ncbi:dihydropteroate synthase [Phaeovulum sp.]|uniref:dihydropteroate synthase n=1 Tax=Phaeovulum sp. TaxID=2934796 RepID=UPI0039E395F3